MLPIPDTTVWSSSCRLISECLRRNTVTTASRSNCGSSGSRAMCATGVGTSVPSTVTRSASIQPAERALVDEAQRGAVVEQCGDPQVVPCRSVAHAARAASARSCPGARPAQRSSSSVSHRYFPRRPVPVIGGIRAAARSDRPGSGLVTAHRARVVHPDGGDGLVDDVRVQSPPDDLDLGKFRHPTQSQPDRPGRPCEGVPRRRGGLQFGLFLGAADARAVLALGDHHRRP